jgi:AcrR family transcriptional regulator
MSKTKEKIVREYQRYLLENRTRPRSVMAFVEPLQIKESTFYRYFASFEHLEKSIWKMLFEQVVTEISSQEVYQGYSINEKLLAFYYSWIELLKDHRSYAAYVASKERFYELYPSDFELFKESFQAFVSELIEEGLATEEIATRRLITDQYKYLFWVQPVSIFKFWIKDDSENYENTDALIEKTVNFSFDLMRSNSLDSFFDLAKHHIQHY